MKVIFHADDFGLSQNVNLGIIHAKTSGLISDISMIVNTPIFLSSIQIANDHHIKQMGLHVLLTVGYPILSKEEIPSLVNKNGRFHDPKSFAKRLYHNQLNYFEIEKEIEAQFLKFKSTGFTLTHIDTHHCFMMRNAQMFNIFLSLANRYQVPLRNEASLYQKENQIVYENLMREQQLQFVNCVYMSKHNIKDIKQILMEAIDVYDVIEIVFHPGYCDEYLKKISPLNKERELDFAIVTDASLKSLLKNHDIQLIDYTEL